jgi:hypothetical protein
VYEDSRKWAAVSKSVAAALPYSTKIFKASISVKDELHIRNILCKVVISDDT